jgi:hypothetical protein
MLGGPVDRSLASTAPFVVKAAWITYTSQHKSMLNTSQIGFMMGEPSNGAYRARYE